MEFTLKITINEPVPARVTPEFVREWFEYELTETVSANLSRGDTEPVVSVTILPATPVPTED